MGQQIGDGDWLGMGIWQLKVIEIVVDVLIQVEPSLFDQLHDRRGGEKLGDGTNSEEGLLRDNGPLVFKVGEAISLGEKDLALFHQHENRAWDVQRLHLFGKESNQG